MNCRACRADTRMVFAKDGAPCFACVACGALSRRARADLAGRYEEYLPGATLSLPPITRRRYGEMLDVMEPFGRAGEMRLLEVGAGAGLFLEVARARGWEAAGTELSRTAVEEAARRGLRVHLGDLADLGLAIGSFDAAVSLETLEHVPDPTSFLRDIRRLLRPGGGLYLTTPNWGALNRRHLGREWLAVSRDHLCLLTPRALRGCLARAGFAVGAMKTRTFLVNEALKRFRRAPARGQGFAPAETASLQASFETRPALRLVKRAANAILGWTELGDVLTALAVREGGA